MAVRDPAFWRRFSIAVHLDEEAQAQKQAGPDLKHTESWLERQRQKKSRRTLLCWAFWIGFIALVAGVVVTILTLKAKGIIK